MKKNDETVENAFYQACADLLGVAYEYEPFPYSKRTRWNNRKAGNGRFPGKGLIRMHGPRLINVSLVSPRVTGFFYNVEDALEAIRKALE